MGTESLRHQSRPGALDHDKWFKSARFVTRFADRWYAPVGIRTRAPGSTGRDHRPLDHRGSGRRKVRSLIILSYRRCEHLPLCLRATDSLVPGALDEQANPSVQRLSFDSPFHLLSARGHVARVDDDSVRTEKPIPPESNESGHCGMRIFRRQAVEHAEGRALKAHLHRNTERQAEVETLQFLLTSIKKRHTWDRIKCTIATGIPAFWILLIALRPYLPTWLHPLLDNVPAIWTIAVSLAIAGFQWRNLVYYQRHVIPLVQEMYERALAKHDRELLTILGNVLRIGKLKGLFRSLFSTSR